MRPFRLVSRAFAFLALCLSGAALLVAQPLEFPAQARVRDGIGEIPGVWRYTASVDSYGRVWLTEDADTAYVSDALGKPFQAVPIAPGLELCAESIDRISFFDRESAIASGTVSDCSGHAYVVRTTDMGTTWDTVRVPAALSDVAIVGRGEAWAVCDSGLAVTRDFGASWLSVPLPDGARAASIAAVPGGRAYVLTSAGALLVLDGASRHWSAVPMPADDDEPRKARARSGVAPALAAADRWIALVRGGGLFVCDTATYEWRRLPVSARSVLGSSDRRGFYAVAVNGALFFVDSGLAVQRVGDAVFSTYARSFRSGTNGVLTTVWPGIEYIGGDTARFDVPLTSDSPFARLDAVAGRADDLWGASGTFLYHSTDRGMSWERDASCMPASRISNFVSLGSDGLLLTQVPSGCSRYDPTTGRMRPCKLDSAELLAVFRAGSHVVAHSGSVRTTERPFIAAATLLASVDGVDWRVIFQQDSAQVLAVYWFDDDTLAVVWHDTVARRSLVRVDGLGATVTDSVAPESCIGQRFCVRSHGVAQQGCRPQFDDACGTLLYRANRQRCEGGSLACDEGVFVGWSGDRQIFTSGYGVVRVDPRGVASRSLVAGEPVRHTVLDDGRLLVLTLPDAAGVGGSWIELP